MSGTLRDACRASLNASGEIYHYYSLAELAKIYPALEKLPYSLKVLLENLLRNEDGGSVKAADIETLANWAKSGQKSEIAFRPSRILLQDFTGVPAVVDLAAMRDAMQKIGGNPEKINPLSPVDLVIDHSVMVDHAGGADAAAKNVALEFSRNQERYEFLRWGAGAFDNFRVVPPGTGICHQVNLEYLSQTVWTREEDGKTYAYPDSVVGTDSHTTMVNGLAVLGWGVGGIEAEAAMLGQPISMLVPDVVGFRLEGKLPEGATATDLGFSNATYELQPEETARQLLVKGDLGDKLIVEDGDWNELGTISAGGMTYTMYESTGGLEQLFVDDRIDITASIISPP